MNATPQGDTTDDSAGGHADRLSPWWWLGVPLAAAAGLSLSAHTAPEFHARWIAGERGLLEFAQLLVALGACGLAVATLRLPRARSRRPLAAWLALLAVSCFCIAGEEASWGQHYFHWRTPDTWATLNDQAETNLHNISSWLDQKPRTLLEIGVILGGIAVPLAALQRPRIRRLRWAVILPPLFCLPAALVAEFARFSERLLAALGYQLYPFHRPSEVQEFYFYLFILLYAVALRRRLSSGGP
jgi:hypothetical protein